MNMHKNHHHLARPLTIRAARPLADQSTMPSDQELVVEHFATAKLPTEHGELQIVAFKNNRDGKDHVALVKGDPRGKQNVLCRIHSECLTGDAFGSLKCDCGPQLHSAMEQLEREGCGIILYMRQEGRGIGLANKVKAYSLQDLGMDTVEANQHLGFDDDLRVYDIAAEMLKLIGPESIVLMTNNPKKVDGLRASGIVIESRLPLQITPNVHNERYLKIKKLKSGHLL
jgi:GTP cyclohydrolase II